MALPYILVQTLLDPSRQSGQLIRPVEEFSSSPVTLGELTLNAYDAAGNKWKCTSLDGWGSPANSLEVVTKPRQRGAWSGDSNDSGRTLAIGGMVTSPSPDDLNAALDYLASQITNEAFLLTVSESGRARWCVVKRSGELLVQRLNNQIAVFSAQVTADDPRKLGSALSGTAGLPSSTGGLLVPFTVPFTISSVVEYGQVNLVNPGNEPGPVRLRIDGPCHGPVVTHVGTGRSLVFASSLELGAGEWLEVDMDKHLTLANGQASRNTYIKSRGWSEFEPGANAWSFTAAEFDPASRLTVTATPAWK